MFIFLPFADPWMEQIFAVHAVGGFIGNLLTGIFAQKRIAAYDNITQIKGGCLDGHAVQLAIQLASSTAGLVYSLVMTVSVLCSTTQLLPNILSMFSHLGCDPSGHGMDSCQVCSFLPKGWERHDQGI